MPCRDDGYAASYASEELSKREAMLCAALSCLEDNGFWRDFLDQTDWGKAGVERLSLELWWSDHKAEDKRRRADEAKAERMAQIKRETLDKLSPEQREALGL